MPKSIPPGSRMLPGMGHGYRAAPAGLWRLLVPNDTGCWVWTGSTDGAGYGLVFVHGRNVHVHRLVYRLTRGVDPGDLHVCHSCDNPPCARPAHLFLGTAADNKRDSMKKGRAAGWGRRVGPRNPGTVGLDEYLAALDYADG